MDSALAISTPIMAQYKSVKNKQLWVMRISKTLFLALPILSLIINSIIVLSLMCWKSKMVKLRN